VIIIEEAAMHVRPIREEDIEPVIQLFRSNYGDDYAIPEFYDPQWVKRGIYSDHIIWLVIEEAGRVVASGAAVLDFGDYNDQIAEIGRLVVDPSVGGRGLGRAMLDALVDASDDRVEFAFGEARTTHIKTQRIFDRVGLVPLGFLPMAYQMTWRESWVLSGQLFNNGRHLRQNAAFQVIPEVEPIARLALKNLELDEEVRVAGNTRPYALDESLDIEPLTGASLVRLLKIEHGRLVDPEVFGGLHLDQGISQLRARKASYLVVKDHGEVLGAVGYLPDGRNVRIIELIAQDEDVKGGLLRKAVEVAEAELEAEVIDCEVSADSPRIQRTLLEMGFLPAAYLPGMVFHNTARWDVVKMMKINIDWNLGPIELTESSQAMFDIVTPAFIRRAEERCRLQELGRAGIFRDLTALEIDLVQQACTEITPEAGSAVAPEALWLVLAGQVNCPERSFMTGDCLGAAVLLGGSGELDARVSDGTRLLSLTPAGFQSLCSRHPRVGLKLYRNFAASLFSKR
jgi:RimJ/RimL family protein N-acetyltransferase